MLKRWNICVARVLAAFSLMQVARAETAANAFVVVEAEGARIGDGDVIHFANATSPSSYFWTATAGGVATNSSTWTGRLSKGLGQEVSFAVVGENGCSDCACRASTAVAVDVCALSIDRPDFIGLDRTDSGRASPTIYSAAVNLDPKPSAAISYDWRGCGICSFTGRTDQARVRYEALTDERK